MKWTQPPRVRIHDSLACSVLFPVIYPIVKAIAVDVTGIQDSIAQNVKVNMESGAGADSEGLIDVCATCAVKDVKVGDGKIDIYTLPGFDSVRLNVSTTRYTDVTSDPAHTGLAIPEGFYTIIAGGGTYESCIAADGTPTAICDKLTLDSSGDFNWWGTDVPVPSPWFLGSNGTYGYNGARANAWERLTPLGLTRHVDQLPTSSFAAGSLLARRSDQSGLAPTTRLDVSNGCMVAPDGTAGAPFALAFGVNDVPVVGTEAPTSGQLDATVLLAGDADTSKLLFGGVKPCAAAPRLRTSVGFKKATLSLQR